MNVALDLPEDVARRLEAAWGDLSVRAKDALAVEAYRSGLITHSEVQSLLSIGTRMEVDAVLTQAGAYLDYTAADLQSDIAAIRKPAR